MGAPFLIPGSPIPKIFCALESLFIIEFYLLFQILNKSHANRTRDISAHWNEGNAIFRVTGQTRLDAKTPLQMMLKTRAKFE